jgi:hypothetical protein
VSILVLVVDDEPDVEALFRQQFRHGVRRFSGGCSVADRRSH